MTGKTSSKSGGARASARLAAVQALFQIEQSTDADPRHVITEFRAFRFGREVEGDLYADPDQDLFEDIVIGASSRGEEIDSRLKAVLMKGWPLERLQSVLRAILRAAVYELIARPDIPSAVIINEYLDIAHAFFEEGGESAFANGVLDRLARDIREER